MRPSFFTLAHLNTYTILLGAWEIWGNYLVFSVLLEICGGRTRGIERTRGTGYYVLSSLLNCSDFRRCFCILATDLMYFIGLRLRDCKAFPHLCNQTYRGILPPSSILLPLLPAWSEGGGDGRRTVQNWFCKIAHSYPSFLVGKVLAPGLSTLKWKLRWWWLCPLVPVIFL